VSQSRLHPDEDDAPGAEVANLARRSKEFGIDIDGAIRPDIDAIVERKDDIVESIRKGAYENVEEQREHRLRRRSRHLRIPT